MKLESSLLFGILFFVIPPILHAEAGWTDYVKISELVPTGRHYYEVMLPVKKNPSDCRNNSWFYQDYAENESDKMFEDLLTGIQTGSQVRVYVTGKCNVNGYAEFTAVGIKP